MKKKILLALLGIFFSLILLETGMRLAGFTILYLQEQGNRQSLKKKDAYRILCLGESTTINQYPRILEDELNNRNRGMKFTVIDKGGYAINTNVILAELENNLDKYKPDMVITMMGNGDGKSGVVLYEYKQQINYYNRLKISSLIGLLQVQLKSKIKLITSIISEKKNKNTLIADPKNIQAYFWLADNCRNTGRYEEAENFYLKAAGLNPGNEQVYIRLGDLYLSAGKLDKAEKQYKKVIEMNPGSMQGYMKLGDWYIEQGRYVESDEPFKKAMEKLNPKDELGSMDLGNSYKRRKSYSVASDLYKKVIALNPKNEQAFLCLGDCYLWRKEYKESEQTYRKVLTLNPKNAQAYMRLVNCFLKQGSFKEAEEQYRKAVEANPKQERTFYFVPDMFWMQPDNGIENYVKLKERIKKDNNGNKSGKSAEDKDMKINSKIIEDDEEQTEHFSAGTVYNYKKLRNILKERNITYVCMQYPTRKIAELKGLFEGDKDIIFADNEKIFKDAVEKDGYNAYFLDKIAEGWGHCTPKGNRLLAKHLADILMDEVFNKP